MILNNNNNNCYLIKIIMLNLIFNIELNNSFINLY